MLPPGYRWQQPAQCVARTGGELCLTIGDNPQLVWPVVCWSVSSAMTSVTRPVSRAEEKCCQDYLTAGSVPSVSETKIIDNETMIISVLQCF